jgi:hypothetical protein
MSNLIYDIEKIHDEFYNCIYNPKTKDEYAGILIDIEDIKNIENLKYALSINKDKKLLKNIFENSKFKLVEIEDNRIIFKFQKKKRKFDAVIKFYNKKHGIDNLTTENNLDKIFTYYVGQAATFKKGNFVEFNLMNIDICNTVIKKYFPTELHYTFENMKKLIKMNEIENIVCLQIKEHYFSKEYIMDFLERTKGKQTKIFLLNLIKNIIEIMNFLPEVLIYNIELSNIIFYKIKKSKTHKLTINHNTYNIPGIDVEIRLKNMKFYSIKKENKMSYLQIIDIIRNLVGELNSTSYKLKHKLNFDSIDKLIKSLISNNQKGGKKKKKRKKTKRTYKEISFGKSDNEDNLETISISSDEFKEININNHENETSKEQYFKMNNINDNNNFSIDYSLYTNKMINNLNKGNILEELKRKNVNSNIINKIFNKIGNNNLNQSGGNKEKKKRKIPVYDPSKNKEEVKPVANYNSYNEKSFSLRSETRGPPRGPRGPRGPPRGPRGPPRGPRGPPRGPRGPSRGPRGPRGARGYNDYQNEEPQNNYNERDSKNYTGKTTHYDKGSEYIAPPIPSFGPYGYPQMYSPFINHDYLKKKEPIIIQNRINIENPVGDNIATHNIYEDMLPKTKDKFYFSNMNDRRNTYNFINNILVKEEEGDEVTLGYDKIGRLNLSSVLKIEKLNPYFNKLFSDNPYGSLPQNMIIFNGCYPVTYNKDKHRIDCGKDSLGVNLRIYSLDDIRLSNLSNVNNFACWRDRKFYQYVRNNILLKNKSPNFLMLYSHHWADDYYIDFNGMNTVRRKYSNKKYNKVWERHRNFILKQYKQKLDTDVPQLLLSDGDYFAIFNVLDYVVRVNIAKINEITTNEIEEMKKHLRRLRINKHEEFITLENLGKHIKDQLDNANGEHTRNIYGKVDVIKNEDIFGESNKMLILITEAPTVSLFDWCTRVYNTDDRLETTIKKMISTGYYNDEIWMNVIFQIMVIIKILYDHNLLVNFNETDPRNISLFIKEQPQGVTNYPRGFYKFIVGGIPYFLPNYGFIVIFDPLSVSETPLKLKNNNSSILREGELNIEQKGGNIYGPPDLLYETQQAPTKLEYNDPLFINPTPLFPIYNHAKPKFESEYYKHLIINELAKIPTHEINSNDAFFIYSKDLYNDEFEEKETEMNVYNKMINKLLGFEWMDNHDFRFAGGIKFSEKIKTLCDNMKIELQSKSKDPKDVMVKYFKNYLHEKVGSNISNFDKVLKDPPNYNFEDGQIIGYLDDEVNGNTIYKWGIVSKASTNNFEIDCNGRINYTHKFEIIKKSDNGEDLENIPFNQYYCKIPIDEKSCPLYTIRSKEGKESIIDTYIVDNK